MSWNQYPWSLPDFLCNLKAWIAETTSCISVMTILLFSIERYIAICHPMLFLKLRNVRAQLPAFLVIAWLIAIAAASPYGINHRADFMLKSWPFTDDGVPVAQSKVCMVAIFFDPSLAQSFYVLIHVSFVIFFAIPLLVILVVYALIAIKNAQMAAAISSKVKKSGRSMATKALIIQEYKRRLRDNVKSLNDNFINILSAAKVRAADELLKLTHDLKEFLILHDFNFLSSAIESAEGKADKKMNEYVAKYDALRLDTASMITDIDKELNEHFSLRQ
ncbi:Mediator of RNA polymerase II transcription subunit 22 [Toxocara canis]|uniref:Mediator of RNA polymerase II transcription subunit 22 n=1 Tax=Toxocara canis TaxID=6265 RepID=A0A0B2W0C0_TOXCA|nr:Mediator of RNA polymerase II transcription subunit 22 [Toxocara canis]